MTRTNHTPEGASSTLEGFPFLRVWTMPNRYTFAIPVVRQLLQEEMKNGQLWVDPFCGKFSPANMRNDIDDNISAEYHEDGLAFLKLLRPIVDVSVLFDPPWSPEQARRCYKSKFEGIAGLMEYQSACKDEINRLVEPGGKVICFGWNSTGMGKKRGFKLVRGMLLNHGARHDTIITIEVKETK